MVKTERVPRWVGFVPTLVVVLAMGGCAAAFRPPTVRVAEVRLTAMNFTGGTLRVALEVENPNRYALESRDFRYALSFADGPGDPPSWITMAEGALEETVRVEGGQTAGMQVLVPFEMTSMTAALGRLLRQGELEYRFTGVLLAGTPLGQRRIPFDQRGRFRP